MSDKRFYDEGWNAAHAGEPYDTTATLDWRDGWKDYQCAQPEHHKPFPEAA